MVVSVVYGRWRRAADEAVVVSGQTDRRDLDMGVAFVGLAWGERHRGDGEERAICDQASVVIGDEHPELAEEAGQLEVVAAQREVDRLDGVVGRRGLRRLRRDAEDLHVRRSCEPVELEEQVGLIELRGKRRVERVEVGGVDRRPLVRALRAHGERSDLTLHDLLLRCSRRRVVPLRRVEREPADDEEKEVEGGEDREPALAGGHVWPPVVVVVSAEL